MPKRAEGLTWTATHGVRLRQRRIEKGLTQQEAAAKLGVTDDTLRNWENGRTKPREHAIAALAEFCDLAIEELVGSEREDLAPTVTGSTTTAADAADVDLTLALPTLAPSSETATFPAVRVRPPRGRWIVLTTVLAASAVVLGILLWPRPRIFAGLRPVADGIEAISPSGQVLWRAKGVDPRIADRWALVRMPGGRTLIACVLVKPWDFRPEVVSKLSLLDPTAKQLTVVDTIQLPAPGAQFFPDYSHRYDMANIRAIDLDGDGVDEILAMYQQVPECVSYTVLYQPAIGKPRIVFAQTGGHHLMGAWDIDGDGHRDLVFLGINNGYDWMNSLAAIRVYPWIRRPDAGDAYTIFSPDHPAYRPVDAAEIFYSLLPRGRVPDDPNAARWDAKQRQLTVTLLNGRTIRLSPFGFFDSAPSQLPDREREALRRQAYHHDREARRLGAGQYWNEALMEARGAVGLAAQAGDPIAKEALQRDLMKLLIASGRSREGIATMDELVLHSENASEIFYEAALALHLAGRLDEAVTYYDAGIRHGSPEEGKSKHEFIQAEVFALVEQGKFDEALAAIRRFNERYTAGDEGWTAPYREFIRWRMGQIPNSFDVPPNATDLLRYWDLEFRSARGEDPKMLLKDVEGMLRENNRPRCSLLSLKAAILKRLGDDAGSRAAARDALAEFQEESARSLAARAAIEVLRQRLRLVSPRAPT